MDYSYWKMRYEVFKDKPMECKYWTALTIWRIVLPASFSEKHPFSTILLNNSPPSHLFALKWKRRSLNGSAMKSATYNSITKQISISDSYTSMNLTICGCEETFLWIAISSTNLCLCFSVWILFLSIILTATGFCNALWVAFTTSEEVPLQKLVDFNCRSDRTLQ